MKKSKRLLIVILAAAILCGVLLAKLSGERQSVLGIWKTSVSGDATLKGILDFSAIDDALLREDLNRALTCISIPVYVRFDADGSYQIGVDRKDAEVVTEEYIFAVRNYMAEYVKKNLSGYAGEGISNAAGTFKDIVKKLTGVDLGKTTDQVVNAVVESMMTDNIDRRLISERIQEAFDASGSYRVAFGRIFFSASSWEDIKMDNVLHFSVSDSRLTLNRSGRNEGGFSSLMGTPLSAA